MKRRQFIQAAGALALGVFAPMGCVPKIPERERQVHDFIREHDALVARSEHWFLDDETPAGLIAWCEKWFDCQHGWARAYGYEGMTEARYDEITEGDWHQNSQLCEKLANGERRYAYGMYALAYEYPQSNTMDRHLVFSLHHTFASMIDRNPSLKGSRMYWRLKDKITLDDGIAYRDESDFEGVRIREIRTRIAFMKGEEHGMA